jgi:hypothetical protein
MAKRWRPLSTSVGSPRSPAYASSKVAASYVEYNRGPLRGWLVFFGLVLFGLAYISAVVWSDLASAVLFGSLGVALIVLGFTYLVSPARIE